MVQQVSLTSKPNPRFSNTTWFNMLKVSNISLTHEYDQFDIMINDDIKLFMKSSDPFVNVLNAFAKLLEEKTETIFKLEKDSTIFPLTLSHQAPDSLRITFFVSSISCRFENNYFVLTFNNEDTLTFLLTFDQLLKIILQYCYNFVGVVLNSLDQP